MHDECKLTLKPLNKLHDYAKAKFQQSMTIDLPNWIVPISVNWQVFFILSHQLSWKSILHRLASFSSHSSLPANIYGMYSSFHNSAKSSYLQRKESEALSLEQVSESKPPPRMHACRTHTHRPCSAVTDFAKQHGWLLVIERFYKQTYLFDGYTGLLVNLLLWPSWGAWQIIAVSSHLPHLWPLCSALAADHHGQACIDTNS